ncbi:hypothetical protein DL96DRAFT_1666647 [Flagelloscypha sp. PMI_526]|nr:hypothetical protein DL96DRAFT_1666647 [Flagelloscypha sp. PMI_526]
MADLGADLYGDLYGNDDSGVSPTAESANDGSVTKTLADMSAAAPKAAMTTMAAQPIQTYAENGNTENAISSASEYGSAERSVRPSEMKDEGKMFIGGLNWDTTDEGLRTYFTQFGKVDACTIMRDAGGRSRCFAFLTFEDPASVNAVMMQEHVLDGKVIDPKRAIPRLEHQKATKLFIGGLPGSVTSESMREFFSQFGKRNWPFKGFGFISFEDTDVRPFLGFGNLEIDGKLIDVKLAQPRYQREADPEAAYGGMPSGHQNRPATTPATATGQAGGTFDPQALAQLYTRMFQMTGGGGMNMMGGMMNPMMMGGMMGGMAGGMGRGGMMGAGGIGVGGMAGMGPVGGGAAMRGGGPGANVPKGPRGAGGASGGPQRSQRGGHSYHPYAR